MILQVPLSSRCIACWPILAIAALLMVSCNAPDVRREEEAARFNEYGRQSLAELKIDPGTPLTMSRCEELALLNSLDLRVRGLTAGLQDEQVRIAMSDAMPKGSVTFDNTDRSNKPEMTMNGQTFALQDQQQRTFSLAAALPILDWGITYYAYKMAQDRQTQERLLLERARQVLVRDVRIAYARHAGAIRQQRLADQAVQAARLVVKTALNLQRENITAPADTALVQAAFAQAELELAQTNQRVHETRLNLAQLMSLPPGVSFSIVDVAPPLPPVPTAPEMAEHEQQALLKRPELAAQDIQRHMSANGVRKEIASFFPRIDGMGSYNWSSDSFAINPSYFLLGFRVTSSLLDGGAQIWRYNTAKRNITIEEQRTLLLSMGIIYEVDFLALRLRQTADAVAAYTVVEAGQQASFRRILSLYQNGLEDEAATAKALAELVVQASALDRARTDHQTTWYEFYAAVLPATAPATQPAGAAGGLSSSPTQSLQPLAAPIGTATTPASNPLPPVASPTKEPA